MFHSEHEKPNWIYIDLGELKIIKKVKIFNRLCSNSRLKDFKAYISESKNFEIEETCYENDGDASNNSIQFKCEGRGRYVRIYNEMSDGYMNLYEIEIFGDDYSK